MTGQVEPTATRPRRRPLLLGVAVGLVVLLLTLALVHDDRLPPAELDVFRAVNDHSVLPFGLVWPFMQLGTIVVALVVAVGAGLRRHGALAATLAAAGLAAWLLAKLLKLVADRGRPAELLENVEFRGAEPTGLGFPSGHAAVGMVLAVLLLPQLSRGGRVVVCLLAVLVGVSRVYVGAHLPLDAVGGWALGLTVACVAQLLVLRRRPGGPSPVSARCPPHDTMRARGGGTEPG